MELAQVRRMDIIKTRPKPMWRRSLLWIAGGVSLLGVLGMSLSLGKAAPSAARNELWIDRAERGSMKWEIRAPGTLLPRDTRWITAGTTAWVQQISVLPGARVQADTVILELANPELQANLMKAQAALAASEADVAATQAAMSSQLLDQMAKKVQAESEWRIAEAKGQALERAHAAGVVAAIELKEIQITAAQNRNRAEIEAERVTVFRRNMDAQLRAIKAHRDETASALALVRQQVESLQVRAGIDGILQQVEVEPGQQIEAGAKLARVARPGDLIARLHVPEVLAKDLALDLPATVDTRNGVVNGKVTRVDPAVRNGSVLIDVAFDQPLPPGARPDLSVDGRIVLSTLRDVISIGRPSMAAPDSTATLFVIRAGDNLARRAPVHFGVVSSDRVEVRSGLNPGDQAVLSDTSQWNDYDTLRLN
jgi:multidrug efflux pump subunit AcrA (membrane-fusion protein)